MLNMPMPASGPAPGAGELPQVLRSMLRMAVADEVLAVPIEDVREILQVGRPDAAAAHTRPLCAG